MKKIIAMLLCVSMLMSAVMFTTVIADETETEPQPTEYIFKNGRGTEAQHYEDPTFTTRGGWEENVTVLLDGVPYRGLISYDRNKNVYVQYNFINTTRKHSNLPDNYTGLKPGYYDFYFFYPLYNANDDSKAKVEVYHNGEITNYTMNQNKYKSGSWNLVSDLSTPLYFAGSGDEYIRITKSSSARLSTAGIKLVQNLNYEEKEPEQTIEEKPHITDVKCENGEITLVTNGSTIEKSKTVFAAVAAFDKGTLAGLKKTAITIEPKSSDATISLNIPQVTNAEYKVYIFTDNNIDTYNF